MGALSIVIATRNRRALLLQTLTCLAQRFPVTHVIVVDNGSTDGSVSAAQDAHPNTTIVSLDYNAGSFARTIGVTKTQTPLIAFCDDDTCWAPGALAAAEHLFQAHPRVGLVCGRLLIEPSLRLDPVCEVMQRSPLPCGPDLPGPSILGFLACAAIVRRDAFLAAGGFHRHYGIGGEEELLAVDMAAHGWEMCYVPHIVAHHAPARFGRNPLQRRARQYRNALWTTWLRRPVGSAARVTLQTVQRNAGDAALWSGFYNAVRGLPWVLRERRVLPAAIERRVQLLRDNAH